MIANCLYISSLATVIQRKNFSDEQKELMKLIGQFIENILIKVEALSDEELGREYPGITDAVKGMKENLRYLNPVPAFIFFYVMICLAIVLHQI